MDFRIAASFTDALARLPAQDQKAVKVSVLDLQLDPSAPGLQMHRIDKSKDENFWSARVNRDLRLILHKTASSILVAYVGHHDQAYAWAERRRIEAHPRTGAIQIVEVRERVEEAAPGLARLWGVPEGASGILADDAPAELAVAEAPTPPFLHVRPSPPLFARLGEEDLLSVGVPADWISAVLAASEVGFYELADHLPSEASEALLEYAVTGILRRPEPVPAEIAADPYQHPDARRRFLTVETTDDLRAALDAPWEAWSVFLHPSQRAVVERTYNGPARVAGSAGTGKTVVALHRAVRLIRADPNARVLLATFSEPLAGSLQTKLAILAGPDSSVVSRTTVASFEGLAIDLFQLAFGRKPRVANTDQVATALKTAAEQANLKGFSQRFLVSEWTGVVDAWRLDSLASYADVPRLGRKNRLGVRQREALWPVFAAAGDILRSQGLLTWPGVFHAVADHYAEKDHKPFTHVVVDEAQDLGVPELRLMCAIAPADGQDRLFFAGDLGQRIFQQPFSWKALGADVRGRSTTLKVNYRTSHQIREAADRLLPNMVRDVDGREEERRGTISVFEGPPPQVTLSRNEGEEEGAVAAFISAALKDGIAPSEIGVFVRSRRELPRARQAVEAAGLKALELSERAIAFDDQVAIGTMHLAKGLEFKAVAVMACDDEVLPLAERIDAVVEESDLDDVIETERHLLYVACTRARDRLMVSAVSPGSEFLLDLLR
jgi:hypothetical protein